MKTFFAKKIRILGKSISLALIIGLVLVVSVAAWGILNMTATASITADSGPTGTMDISCHMVTGPGTIDSCLVSNSSLTLVVSGVQDTSVIQVLNWYTPDNNQIFNFVMPDPMPGAVSQFILDLPPGSPIASGFNQKIEVVIHLANIVPGEVISDLVWEYNFTD